MLNLETLDSWEGAGKRLVPTEWPGRLPIGVSAPNESLRCSGHPCFFWHCSQACGQHTHDLAMTLASAFLCPVGRPARDGEGRQA